MQQITTTKTQSLYISLTIVVLSVLSSISYGWASARVSADTTKKISLIFEVSHGEQNSIEITNHPEFKNSPNTHSFEAQHELPDGMSLTNSGTLQWQPNAEQFNSLKNSPVQVNFTAFTPPDQYVIGQVRVIGIGDAVIDTSTANEKIATEIVGGAGTGVVAESDEIVVDPIEIIIPGGRDWNEVLENKPFELELKANGGTGEYKFELLEPVFLMEMLDPYGVFSWTPEYDFVSTDEKVKSVMVKVKVFDDGGNEATTDFALYVDHVNQPPVVNEMPTFYIQYNRENTYQLKRDGLAFDPDGDSIIFTPVLNQMLQGMSLNKNGEISWKPSTSQFKQLRRKPKSIAFYVQEYPAGARTRGQIRLEVSRTDEPPIITMVPNKNTFDLKENDELHLNFVITDPNGEEDLLSFGFVSENSSIKTDALKKKDDWIYEFSWTPGYDFIKEVGEKDEFDISFFAIDRESKRTERNILVTVHDTENLVEKDRILYDQYRTVLERAFDLISQLNEKEKEFEKAYKHARKGKKNRAITTASLGALTGLSPIIFLENPDGQKITAGLGGTATATLGTLEASNVIGESPADIMRNLNYVTQKKNDLLVYGTVYASKYALPVSKRDKGFQSDLRNLSVQLNLKDVAQLELDPTWENKKSATAKNIKKIFKDFNPDPRFEDDYKK